MASKITKADIEKFRSLARLHLDADAFIRRLEKKLNCQILCPSEWPDSLEGMSLESDEDVVYAIGIVSYR